MPLFVMPIVYPSARDWLIAQGHPAEGAPWLAGIMAATLPLVRGAAYLDGFVIADNSMLPRSVARAWWGAEVQDSLIPWEPERDGALVLDRARLGRLLAEKDNALAAARTLMERVEAGEPGLTPELHAAIRRAFAGLLPWVEGMRLCVMVCLHCRFLSQPSAAPCPEIAVALARDLDALEAYAEDVRGLAEDPAIPHQTVMLVDYRRALDVVRGGRATLAETMLSQRSATHSAA